MSSTFTKIIKLNQASSLRPLTMSSTTKLPTTPYPSFVPITPAKRHGTVNGTTLAVTDKWNRILQRCGIITSKSHE